MQAIYMVGANDRPRHAVSDHSVEAMPHMHHAVMEIAVQAGEIAAVRRSASTGRRRLHAHRPAQPGRVRLRWQSW